MATFPDPIEVNMSEAFKENEFNITVPLVVHRDWRFKIGFALIWLGARFMKCACKAHLMEDEING